MSISSSRAHPNIRSVWTRTDILTALTRTEALSARELAKDLGMTERHVWRIMPPLVEAGLVKKGTRIRPGVSEIRTWSLTPLGEDLI